MRICRRSWLTARREAQSRTYSSPGGGSGGGSGPGGGGSSGGGGGDDGQPPGPSASGFAWKGWQDRVAADPQFAYKMAVEQVIGVTSMVAGDALSRPNFGLDELDFVFATLVSSCGGGEGGGRGQAAVAACQCRCCTLYDTRPPVVEWGACPPIPAQAPPPTQVVGICINFAAVYLLAPVPPGAGATSRSHPLQRLLGTYYLDLWRAPRECCTAGACAARLAVPGRRADTRAPSIVLVSRQRSPPGSAGMRPPCSPPVAVGLLNRGSPAAMLSSAGPALPVLQPATCSSPGSAWASGW
jgi:hypothetical protein